ncbi:ATP-binding protein [Actinoplanes sp. LDG1-06]|uniref:histidine kinase n=1 Tax=Paractinoplanes ovalisporus TaxID=2810368 RepID=A0ABS2AIG7_9ACTN|nr:histidine kinase [Actinoplanes ovalisporus]MBM2619024.1 ATP-binding protein [Actinoplanes ovalisporus]
MSPGLRWRPRDAFTVTDPLLPALLLGLLAGAAVGVAGAPYWRNHPVAAVIVIVDCAALATAGGVLASGRSTRRTGLFMIGGAFAWSANWLTARDSGIFPLAGNWGNAVYFALLGIGVLLYPTGRLQNAAARLWTAAAVIVLGGTQLMLTVFGEPEWSGFSASSIWPTLHADRNLFDLVIRLTTYLYLLLAATYAITLVVQFRTARGFTRLRIAPLIAGVALIGLVSAVAQQGDAMTDAQAALRAYVIQGTTALLVPIALMSGTILDRLRSAAITSRIVPMVNPATEDRVREALARTLRDETLVVYFWSVPHGVFVDAYGDPVDTIGVGDPASAPPGRVWIPVTGPVGEPLALLDTDAELGHYPQHLEAAVTAVRPALQNARLHAELRAQLERTRAAQAAARTAEERARDRIRRDLHDGVQGNLTALQFLISRESRRATDPYVRTLLDRIREQIAESNEDLRTYVRGGVPAALQAHGLRPVLEVEARRSPVPVTLDVVGGRFDLATEVAVYFCVKEGMQNAVRHGRPTRIEVRVTSDARAIAATVADDGQGGARFTPAGGLTGLRDRIGELGGSLEVGCSDGYRTILTVTLPRPAATSDSGPGGPPAGT